METLELLGWLSTLLVLGDVLWRGDVRPVSPPPPLNRPPATVGGDFDRLDGDEEYDWITDKGHFARIDRVNPNDPNPTGGTIPHWNSPEVWNNYDDKFDVTIGQSQQGYLEVNGASALRVQSLKVGAGGVGELRVTGFGSEFSTDRDVIPWDARQIIAAYQTHVSSDATDVDPATIVYTDLVTTTAFQRGTGNYAFEVGNTSSGRGAVVITNGGFVAHRGAVTVATVPGGSGTIFVGTSSQIWGTVNVASTLGAGATLVVGNGGTAIFAGAVTHNGRIASVIDEERDTPGRLSARTLTLGEACQVLVTTGTSLELIASETSSGGVVVGTGLAGAPAHTLGVLGCVVIDGGVLTLVSALDGVPPCLLRRPGNAAATPAVAPAVGTLVVRGGELRLPTGLHNFGLIRLSGRVTVHGALVNEQVSAIASPPSAASQGVILIDGDDADVVFADGVTNDGKILAAPGARVTFAGGLLGTRPQVDQMPGCPRPVAVLCDTGTGQVRAYSGIEDDTQPVGG